MKAAALILLLAAAAYLSLAVDRGAVESESLRLQALSEKRDLTVGDLSALDNLTKPDPPLHGEVTEAEWMIAHNFTRHVAHSINAVYWIAKDGQWLCPADPLSHVGIFLRYNETVMARDALEEGRSSLDPWLAQAQAVREKDPQAYPGLDALAAAIRRVISDMDRDDYASAMIDSAYVDQNAFC